MFRTDRDALAQEVEDLRQEREALRAENEAMRTDLLARRTAPSAPRAPTSVYKQDIAHLSPGERIALGRHDVGAFPVWAAVLLHFVTLGIFPFFHFSALHDKLPKAEPDDPSAARAIGFAFIPYFNLYWIVFSVARLTDRINLQFRLRGIPDRVPRGLAIAAAVLTVIPYINLLFGFFFLWPIAIARLQSAANALSALRRDGADAASDDAWATGEVRVPPMRVPEVRDLPGPADAIDQQAEIEAD